MFLPKYGIFQITQKKNRLKLIIKKNHFIYVWRVVDISSELKDKIGTIAQSESIGKIMCYSPHHSIRLTVITNIFHSVLSLLNKFISTDCQKTTINIEIGQLGI